MTFYPMYIISICIIKDKITADIQTQQMKYKYSITNANIGKVIIGFSCQFKYYEISVSIHRNKYRKD